MSVKVVVVDVGRTVLEVMRPAGQTQSAEREDNKHPPGDFEEKPLNLRKHLAGVAEEVDAACRTWRRTLFGYGLLAASYVVLEL